MARKTLPLSDSQIKNEKPRDKQFTLFDGDGLFVVVMPTGSKLWRFKYRFEGKEKILALGSYPEISLSAAREKRKAAREQVAVGIDPAAEKKHKKAVASGFVLNSFETIARAWHKSHADAKKWDEEHAKNKLRKLENDLFPAIGKRPIDVIEPPELLKYLQLVVGRGALEGAHRLLYDCTKIWGYAIALGVVKYNAALQLKGILPAVKNNNYAAFTKPKDAARLLQAIDSYSGSHVVRAALLLAPMSFLRPGNLRALEWSEIDFDSELCEIPATKMKMKKAHVVPLSKQAVEILRDLQPFTGTGKYVFPSTRGKTRCMSENTVNMALRALGFSSEEMVGHGFRAMARTMGREQLKINVELLEIQLAHLTKSPNGTAYDRVDLIDERREMIQKWADYLDHLKAS